MRLLACDIGSTNLKMQIFELGSDGTPEPSSEARLIQHDQKWLKADNPQGELAQWLSDIANLTTDEYGSSVDAVGFSTFREAVVGCSVDEEIVFAGTNLREQPVGNIEQATRVTTFAGWICQKLTGRSRVTAGQRAAGSEYVSTLTPSSLPWATTITAGHRIAPNHKLPFDVYLGGTDEQLGYVGTGLFRPDGPSLAIATATFWGVSRLAVGAVLPGMRRTVGEAPFRTVDGFGFYKWGPMMHAMAGGAGAGPGGNDVSPVFYGNASTLWYTEGATASVTRQAVIDDLKQGSQLLARTSGTGAIVYGGGVRSEFARDVVSEACGELNLTYMDGDATLQGCAIVGKNALKGY